MNTHKTLLIFSASLLLIGCVNYPEHYTYSPSVSINGAASGTSSPVILPNPFATNKSESRYYVQTPYTAYGGAHSQPSVLTARISRPPVGSQYYYDDENSDIHSNFEEPVDEMVFESY
jgi:hypothetical protein